MYGWDCFRFGRLCLCYSYDMKVDSIVVYTSTFTQPNALVCVIVTTLGYAMLFSNFDR